MMWISANHYERGDNMSKKVVFVVALLAALTMTALAGTGLAFAQEPTPPTPDYGPGYGCCGGWGRGGGWGGHGMGLIDALADLSGMEPADLYAEMQEGKTLLEVAQDHSVTVEQLVEATLAYRAKVLQQRVEAGYLTQEQADWMLKHMREEMLEHLEAGVSPGFNCWRFGGQPGGWGRGHGGGRGMPGSTS
jgi:Spy/CpxP family protein refolding chaperone